MVITSGPRGTILKGKRHKIYKIVENSIGEPWFWSMIRNPLRGNNYAIHKNGKLAGFAIMGKNLPNLGGSAYIFLIGARPGQGYGSELLAQIIKDAKRRKLKYIFLEPTEERVRIWYRKFGFKNINPGLMALNLSTRTPLSPRTSRSASVRSASRSAPSPRRQTPRTRTVGSVRSNHHS